MNQSIYLMVSMPYLALGGIGFVIYRGCKKNAAYLQCLPDAAAPPTVLQSDQGPP
jgi:hypothetical protein